MELVHAGSGKRFSLTLLKAASFAFYDLPDIDLQNAQTLANVMLFKFESGTFEL